MDNLVLGLVYLCLALIVISLLIMVAFAARNAVTGFGDQSKMGMAAFALPILVFVVVYAVNAGNDQALATAAIFTAIVVAASGLLALVISGVRSLVA